MNSVNKLKRQAFNSSLYVSILYTIKYIQSCVVREGAIYSFGSHEKKRTTVQLVPLHGWKPYMEEHAADHQTLICPNSWEMGKKLYALQELHYNSNMMNTD